MRGKKYFITLAVVYLAYLAHGMQAIVGSQNLANLATQWGTDAAGVYNAISYTGLAKFVTVWICGEISDKIGRKKCAVIGAVMYVIFFVGCMTTTSLSVACVCMFMAGAATSFFDGCLYAAAQESWPKGAAPHRPPSHWSAGGSPGQSLAQKAGSAVSLCLLHRLLGHPPSSRLPPPPSAYRSGSPGNRGSRRTLG